MHEAPKKIVVNVCTTEHLVFIPAIPCDGIAFGHAIKNFKNPQSNFKEKYLSPFHPGPVGISSVLLPISGVTMYHLLLDVSTVGLFRLKKKKEKLRNRVLSLKHSHPIY